MLHNAIKVYISTSFLITLKAHCNKPFMYVFTALYCSFEVIMLFTEPWMIPNKLAWKRNAMQDRCINWMCQNGFNYERFKHQAATCYLLHLQLVWALTSRTYFFLKFARDRVRFSTMLFVRLILFKVPENLKKEFIKST